MSVEDIGREVAWRVFSREYNDSDWSFKEGDDDRSPNYVVTPTAAKINRLFVVGVVTEIDNIGEDNDLYRARISDPTGAHMVYAGQYQPDAMSLLSELQTPEFIAVVGKARTYTPEDGDQVYTSIRPEEINQVDAETRDRWNLKTAQQTLKRIQEIKSSLNGKKDKKTPGLHDTKKTIQHYNTDTQYLRELAETSIEVIADLSTHEVNTDQKTQKLLENQATPQHPGTETAKETDGDIETDDIDREIESINKDTETDKEIHEDTETDKNGDINTGSMGEEVDEDIGTEKSDAESEEKTELGDVDQEIEAAESSFGDVDIDEEIDENDVETTDEEIEIDENDVDEVHEDIPTDESGGVGGGVDVGDDDVEEDADVDVDGEWEWSDGQREEVKEEFGDDFVTGAEFDSGGDSDLTESEVGSGEGEMSTEDNRVSEEDQTSEKETASESEDLTEVSESENDDGTGDEDSSKEVVLNVIEDNAGDEGVGRDEIKNLAEERGVSRGDCEDILEDLLMEGMCYPADSDRIKPI